MTDIEVFGPKDLPTTIRDFRAGYNISQTVFANLVGDVAQMDVSGWERATQPIPENHLPRVLVLLQDEDLQISPELRAASRVPRRSSRDVRDRAQRIFPSSLPIDPLEAHIEYARTTSGKRVTGEGSSLAVSIRTMTRELAAASPEQRLSQGKILMAGLCVAVLKKPDFANEMSLVITRTRRIMRDSVDLDPKITDSELLVRSLRILEEEAILANTIYGELHNWPFVFGGIRAAVTNGRVDAPKLEPLFSEREAGLILKAIDF